jgi:prepilin-type processing-associated H-X9-DG protein
MLIELTFFDANFHIAFLDGHAAARQWRPDHLNIRYEKSGLQKGAEQLSDASPIDARIGRRRLLGSSLRFPKKPLVPRTLHRMSDIGPESTLLGYSAYRAGNGSFCP